MSLENERRVLFASAEQTDRKYCDGCTAVVECTKPPGSTTWYCPEGHVAHEDDPNGDHF